MTRQGRLGMPNQQAGVALVMLLWFIAAMSLLVTGLMGEAKLDIRLSQLYLRQAQAEALGDGAAQRAMQAMLEMRRSGEPVPSVFEWGDEQAQVQLIANVRGASGYVDLNWATEPLLVELFVELGELESQAAAVLASTIIKWRGQKSEQEVADPDLRYGRFEAPEDLLLVKGVSRSLFDKVLPALAVNSGWHPEVNIMSAPPEVLRILAGGDESLMDHWQQAQREPGAGAVQPSVKPDLVGSSNEPIYRIEVLIKFADGLVFRRVRWAEYGQKGLDQLPWRFFRTEPIVRVSQPGTPAN